MKKTIILALAIITMLVLVGCGPKVRETVTVTDGDGEAEVTVTGEGEAEEEEGFVEKFQDFVTMKSEYMVSYDFTSTGIEGIESYSMTQYYGGLDKIRIDSVIEGEEARMYMLSDGFYTCTMPEGNWQCLKIATTTEAETQDMTTQFRMVEEAPEDYDVDYAGTKRVAGTTTRCYKIIVPQATLTECFSKEGVPLYMNFDSKDWEYEMTATSYKASVSSADFQLPAEAMDIEEMMAQYGGGEMPETEWE